MPEIIGTQVITMRDLLSGLRRDGSRDQYIVDMFIKKNPFLDDMIVIPANEGQVNATTVRGGLPSVAWTGIYGGPTPSKSSKRIVKDAAGMAESMLTVAQKAYDKAPQKEMFLADEAATHIEAMGQAVATAMIYGNIKNNPLQFNGLSIRYPIHGGTDEDEGPFYVINGSRATGNSTAALRSIWLVGHSSTTIHGFYPNDSGATAGIVRDPLKSHLREDPELGNYEELYQMFRWQIGLAVKDFRYAGRISNIESDAMFNTTGMPDYLELIRRIVNRVESNGANMCWYMDKMTFEMVQVLCGRKTQENAIRSETLFDRQVTTLFGYPVRKQACMNVNEDATTAVA
jgi:hypothetical protein